MANSKDNISKYATSFIGFDETIGNVYDSIGGYVGTLYNAPTRVTGWNGKGSAMNFNGSNQYVQFNGKLFNSTTFSIRFKVYSSTFLETNFPMVVDTRGAGSNANGFLIIKGYGCLLAQYFENGLVIAQSVTDTLYTDKWNDIFISLDTINKKMNVTSNGVNNTLDLNTNSLKFDNNLTLGKNSNASSNFSSFTIDQIEIYNRIISPIPDKYLVWHNNQYKYHNGASWLNTTNSAENFIQYGMSNLDHITEAQWLELTGTKSLVMWTDFEDKEQAIVLAHTEPSSVYDYISENPQVLIYTESTEDIVVSTTTEPFDLYDEFGDEVEVLYYTDDETVLESDLIIEANWSPVDELEGNFEVVTWTDESQETAQRVLEMVAIPKPQFVHLVDKKRIYGYLDDILISDISQSYRNETRYFITGSDSSKWYVWDKFSEKFNIADASTNDLILKNGMKYADLKSITEDQWRLWLGDYLNIGVFLKDNPRDTIVSVVESISYQDYLPRHSSTIENLNLYILNTTAKIDLEMIGNTITGQLSDDDLTRVQYRIFLNDRPYYPADGNFTSLKSPPLNIETAFRGDEIKIDDWNTVKVEFQDFFGTTDYWQSTFVGRRTGLLFKDVYGEYYSTEIGEILKLLDFENIVAGSTSLEHEVILRNQYGFDVKNIHLYTKHKNNEVPPGVQIQYSQSSAPFIPHSELRLNEVLPDSEEISFFVRIKTELGVTPDINGEFDIIVKADKTE